MEDDERAPRTCVFCGSGDLSKEHVLPRWLWREANVDDDTRSVILSREPAQQMETHVRDPSGSRETVYVPIGTMPTIRATAVRVKVVCRGCNHGWMSQLETAAQRPLRRMFHEPSWTLTGDEVRTLRRWAAKTALMNEYSSEGGPSVLTQAMLDAVRDDTDLPGTWHMGLARIRPSLHFAMSSTPVQSSLYADTPDWTGVRTPRSSVPYAIQHLVAAWKIVFIIRYSPYQELPPASLWSDLRRYPRGDPIRLTDDLAGRKTRTKHLPDFVPRNWEDLTYYWSHAPRRQDAYMCLRHEDYPEPVIVTHDTVHMNREGWSPL